MTQHILVQDFDPTVEPPRRKPGMTSVSPERRSEIARKGGIAAHVKGTAFEFQKGSEKAREAGRKGGAVHAAKMQARREEAARVAAFRQAPLAETNERMGRAHLAALDAEESP